MGKLKFRNMRVKAYDVNLIVTHIARVIDYQVHAQYKLDNKATDIDYAVHSNSVVIFNFYANDEQYESIIKGLDKIYDLEYIG